MTLYTKIMKQILLSQHLLDTWKNSAFFNRSKRVNLLWQKFRYLKDSGFVVLTLVVGTRDLQKLSNMLNTGYSFWDRLHNFLQKFTWIVLSVHKLNKLGKFMDNCWISCKVMADMKKVYDDLIIINLYKIYFMSIGKSFNE